MWAMKNGSVSTKWRGKEGERGGGEGEPGGGEGGQIEVVIFNKDYRDYVTGRSDLAQLIDWNAATRKIFAWIGSKWCASASDASIEICSTTNDYYYTCCDAVACIYRDCHRFLIGFSWEFILCRWLNQFAHDIICEVVWQLAFVG